MEPAVCLPPKTVVRMVAPARVTAGLLMSPRVTGRARACHWAGKRLHRPPELRSRAATSSPLSTYIQLAHASLSAGCPGPSYQAGRGGPPRLGIGSVS